MRRTPVSREFWQDLLATGYRSSMTFAVACLLLVVVFALGGSSRGDVFALLFLRPAAIVALGCGLWTLRPAHIAAHEMADPIPVLHKNGAIDAELVVENRHGPLVGQRPQDRAADIARKQLSPREHENA